MIYHLTSPAEWQAAQAAGHYQAPSLATEGFIHCSGAHQVARTANLYFQGQGELVLLHIQEDALTAQLKYELAGDQWFPHLYGLLNLAAVVRAESLVPGVGGQYAFHA
jgi:uncharacterized protein (DUF952 family)